MRRTLIVLIVISLSSFLSVLPAARADLSQSSLLPRPRPRVRSRESTPEEAETDPDMALVESKCSLCHTTERVWSADYDRARGRPRSTA